MPINHTKFAYVKKKVGHVVFEGNIIDDETNELRGVMLVLLLPLSSGLAARTNCSKIYVRQIKISVYH